MTDETPDAATEAGPEGAAAETPPASGSRWRMVLPAGAFLSGFLWDAFTLGREIKSTDLLILGAYFTAAAAILVLMGRNATFRGSSRLNLVLQFLFGGMFSALVVLYFVSAGGPKGFVVVTGLVILLVTNEFLGERYRRLTLSWAVFGVCGVMLLNFFLPHLFRSLHPAWFHVSLVIATGLVAVLRRLARDEDAVVWPTFVVAGVLAACHLLNLIPPVPLASRALVVASELERRDGSYVVGGRTVPGVWPLRPPTIVVESGSPVYCFTSVFVPKGIRTTIRHRWMRRDPGTGEWQTTDVISFPVVGGRRGGYRGYTVKRHVSDGDWEIVAEAESGSAIASTRFRLTSVGSRRARSFERIF